MSLITYLPFELWLEITRNVISKRDLCQLRIVNSTFNILATPALFHNIKVRNDEESAARFWSLIHASHIVQYVRSVVYVESTFPLPTYPYGCVALTELYMHYRADLGKPDYAEGS